ncbi:hypothetical protein OFB62_29760, partial [Escherichia coli]|nr:hypothetical protein [Escherichia coli]
IYQISPIGPKHTFHVGSLNVKFETRGLVLPQSALRLSESSDSLTFCWSACPKSATSSTCLSLLTCFF